MASDSPRASNARNGLKGFLSDVVAYIVCCTAKGSIDDKDALTNKLMNLGASVNTRFSKDITHIIFRRNASASTKEKDAEDEVLRGLFARAEKVWIFGAS